MKEFPDDELDKLFRKSAEELDSTFDPDDWNALKRKLDEQDGKVPGAYFKKWWPLGLLALLFVAGLTTYVLTTDGDTEKIKVSRVTAARQLPGKTVPSGAQKTEKNSEQAVEEEKSVSTSDPEMRNEAAENTAVGVTKAEKYPEGKTVFEKYAGRKVINKAESRKILPRRWSKTGGVYLEPDRSIGRRVDGASYADNTDPAYPVNKKENFLSDDQADGRQPDALSVTDPTNRGAAQNRLLIHADFLKSKSFGYEKANQWPEIGKVAAQPTVEPARPSAEKEPDPKFAVRFGYSPDLSSVGFKNFTKPGTAVSLFIEYSFLPRLYVQTGLIRSSKGYNAKAGEYEWPSSWNDQKTLPTSVDAVCKVIELPLNLRFDIARGDRSRWFAGAGASSYYMQNEKYDYNYPAHTYNIKWYDYETATGWYWLSHLNVSAGYEYRFSRQLSLLAEPYVRVPVKKVGYGKVDLFSTGIWFSLRYTPGFK